MSQTMRWSTGCLTCICTLALCTAPAWAQLAKGGQNPTGPGNKGVQTTGLKPTADETPKNPAPPAPASRTLYISLSDADGAMISGGTVAAMNNEGVMVKASSFRQAVHVIDGLGRKTTIMVDHPTLGNASLEVNLPGGRESWVTVIFDARGNAFARFDEQTSAARIDEADLRSRPEGPCSTCCAPNGGVGCDDAACEALVCAADPFCCSTSWDSICSGEADPLCGDLCPCGGPGLCDCCSANGGLGCDCDSCEALVCAADPFCCGTAWDGICAGEAATLCGDLCAGGECGGGTTCSNCCSPNGGLGCDDPACEALVCAADPFCCDTAWDGICAGEAATLCGDLCPCTGPCGSPCGDPGSGSCCVADGTPGCEDEDCCCAVCALDPFCCDVGWDGICVSEAQAEPACEDDPSCQPAVCDPCVGIPEDEPNCGLPTDTVNGGCNSPSGLSNCCLPNGGLGCDDDACEAIVCAADPFCCDTAWDGICAGEAASLCGDLCTGGVSFPFWTDFECGETYCGTGAFDGATRDTDWYRITLDAPTVITQSVTAEFQSLIGLIEYLPGTQGSGDCADISGFINPAGFGNTPCVKTIVTTICLSPGTYFFFVAPQFTNLVDCGGAGSNYPVSFTCETPCEPPQPPPNDDCEDAIPLAVPSTTEGTTFLASPDATPVPCGTSVDGPGVWYSVIGTGTTITATTCTDFFGFDTKLHVFCKCAGGGGLSNCCTPNGGLGCDDDDCEAIVCGADPFCCDTAWDGICAGEAASLCGDLCAGGGGGGVQCVTGNDDNCVGGADPFLSTVSWCSELGCEYLIFVSGFGGQTGPFDLVITEDGQSCTPLVECCPAPTGACCFDCGFCEVLTQEGCNIAGGSYQGDDTNCGVFAYSTEVCASDFEDISGTGTLAPIASSTDDGGDAGVPIGFTFSFFNTDHADVAVCSNGYLTFGATLSDFTNDAISNPAELNNYIGPLWDDWAPNQGGDVYYQTLGAAGSQRFIVQWNNVVHFAGVGNATFQAVLYEGSNCIEYRYGSPLTYDTPTVGVENADGSDGYPGGFGPVVGTGDCLRLCPSTSGNPCPLVAPQPQVWCTADPITPPQEAGCLLRLNWEIITPCLATENAYIDIGCAQIPVSQGQLVLLNCDATYCDWAIVNDVVTISSNYAVLHVEITDAIGQVRNCHLDLCLQCP